MKNINACFSHNSDDWKTPKTMYDFFTKKLNCIDCFPYQSKYDELLNHYKNQKLFINPPFSKLAKITPWIIEQYNNGCDIWLLIPSRTDTKYFHELLNLHSNIYFIKGRLHYNDGNCAPFPSLIMHLSKKIIFPLYLGVGKDSFNYEDNRK